MDYKMDVTQVMLTNPFQETNTDARPNEITASISRDFQQLSKN